jgi:hypothetical protein
VVASGGRASACPFRKFNGSVALLVQIKPLEQYERNKCRLLFGGTNPPPRVVTMQVRDLSAVGYIRFAISSLLTTQKPDDLTCMDQYSANTRVELTALGWLHIAEDSLKHTSKPVSKWKQAERKRQAGIALRAAISEIERKATATKSINDTAGLGSDAGLQPV